MDSDVSPISVAEAPPSGSQGILTSTPNQSDAMHCMIAFHMDMYAIYLKFSLDENNCIGVNFTKIIAQESMVTINSFLIDLISAINCAHAVVTALGSALCNYPLFYFLFIF